MKQIKKARTRQGKKQLHDEIRKELMESFDVDEKRAQECLEYIDLICAIGIKEFFRKKRAGRL